MNAILTERGLKSCDLRLRIFDNFMISRRFKMHKGSHPRDCLDKNTEQMSFGLCFEKIVLGGVLKKAP